MSEPTPELVAIPAAHVLSLRSHCACCTAQPQLWSQLCNFMDQHEIAPTAPSFTILHDLACADGSVELEVCIPVDPSTQIEATGDIRTRVVEGIAQAAVLTNYGAFDALYSRFVELDAWLLKHGKTQCGPAREIYVTLADDETKSRALSCRSK